MDYKNLAFWILVILVLGLCIYFVVYTNSESFECMSNPLVYGVKQFNTNIGEFTCSCSSTYSKQSLYVTKEGISTKDYLLPLS